MAVKFCTKCKQQKPVEQFSLHNKALDGRRNACKSCTSDYYKGYYKRTHTPEKARLSQIKTRYGLTATAYYAMLKAQQHKCAICQKDEVDSNYRTLYVDHDHSSGKVRGLLCDKCNTGLGHFQDNEAILTAAIEYLRNHYG